MNEVQINQNLKEIKSTKEKWKGMWENFVREVLIKGQQCIGPHSIIGRLLHFFFHSTHNWRN